MRSRRPTVPNPLSFSLLDLVMGLVSVILIGSFALAAQPSSHGQVQDVSRSLLIEQTNPRKDDNGLLFGVAVFHSGGWVFSHSASSRQVKFSSLGAGSSKQQLFLLFEAVPSDAKVLIYLSTPRVNKGGVDLSERSVTISVRAIEKNSARTVPPEKLLSADDPVWELSLEDVF